MFLQKSRPILILSTILPLSRFSIWSLVCLLPFLLSLLGIFWSIRRIQNVSAKKVDQFDFIDNFATLEFQYSVFCFSLLPFFLSLLEMFWSIRRILNVSAK